MDIVVYSTENLYGALLRTKMQGKINRVCINGQVTSCGNCVGFCRYNGHPGFLTREMRKEHNCIKKGCLYYLAKKL